MIGKSLGAGKKRKSKKFEAGRSCAFTNCSTHLSIYNKKKFCFLHSPVSYPRIRGHITRDQGE